MEIPKESFSKIVEHLPEGIILMDEARIIHYMNYKASAMTGWMLGGSVPYCSYCSQREIEDDENRCILTSEQSIPFFNSHMAVYEGMEEFEMSLKKLLINDQLFFVLRIRQPVENEHSERARFHELLVQETMLAQEAERKRIARELHDHIGQGVYSIFLGLEVIKQNVQDPIYQSHISNMVNVMGETLDDIKQLTKSLRSEMLFHVGIKESLREAIRNWMNLYQIVIELDLDFEDNGSFDREKELHLFRIIQEAVVNAVRHGKADMISIHLKLHQQYIFFTIYDNGTGFEMENNYKGLGLRHILERSRILDGDIRWSSKLGGPTKVEGFVSLIKDGGVQ
ncbi:Histidine kinase-, DNA gyrase B-, and HSP90-like ATPase [Mesobacillus persicus]|uniref:histidine kinase n=1 Tax=Mesobacillus persicus TaxID=930146 RepID=A0A1H8EW91_9BACI|nr:histidine kinase [Mesobacillus persicus]SEN23670.1 Histidine kinase-, DNA gyrase B-, and HSP90-like ATPase [Mesobacillus persicus]